MTGVRLTTTSQLTVMIGSTNITPSDVRPNLNMPGEDLIKVTLPSSLTPAPDLPVVVTASISGVTFSSRPAATAPKITIVP
jgi:hypothetical protein